MMYNGIGSSGNSRRGGLAVVEGWWGRANSWRGGLAVADSLDGPWRNVGMALEPSQNPKHFTYQAAIHVPSLVPFKGKWYAYFHTGPSSPPGCLPKWDSDCIAVAVADRPEGPWKIADQPAFQQPAPDTRHVSVEDVGVFVWNDRVYLLNSDFFGHVSGVSGGVVMFVSEDGLSFPFDKVRLAVDLFPLITSSTIRNGSRSRGSRASNRFEAPRVMMIDGRPAYFLAGSGTNVDGGPTTAGYLMKIRKWEE